MAHRRGGFRGRGISQSQRRKKAWIAVKQANTSVTATGSLFTTAIHLETAVTPASSGGQTSSTRALIDEGIQGLGDEVSTLPEESTILRIRGSLLMPKNSIGVAQQVADNYSFGFGVTDIRSIVGGSSPLPISDVDWDGWMFLRQSASVALDSNATILDVKAMRKIKTGDAFFATAQAVTGDTTATPVGNFLFDLRLLMLLP